MRLMLLEECLISEINSGWLLSRALMTLVVELLPKLVMSMCIIFSLWETINP